MSGTFAETCCSWMTISGKARESGAAPSESHGRSSLLAAPAPRGRQFTENIPAIAATSRIAWAEVMAVLFQLH